MPFAKHCRMTLENRDIQPMTIFYQINYCLSEVPENAAYFCAQFRRVNPLPYKEVYTILDDVNGKGHYVGTYLACKTHNNGWWGEGEIKFYLDDDSDFPTICGTETEDYFGGSYDFEDPVSHNRYLPFTTPYSGLPQVIIPDRFYNSQMRFGMYRWHITDPVRFEKSCALPFKRWAGVMTSATYRFRMILHPSRIGTRLYQHLLKPLPDRDQLEIN